MHGIYQSVKRAYPEIDIYAHAKTIAQSQASVGVTWLDLMLQRTEGFTRGTEIVPANKAVKHDDRIISEFDVQFGPSLNKMYLELEAF